MERMTNEEALDLIRNADLNTLGHMALEKKRECPSVRQYVRSDALEDGLDLELVDSFRWGGCLSQLVLVQRAYR